MSTIACTNKEFKAALGDFWTECGKTSNTQDQIANGHKCVCLMYLGVTDFEDDDDMQRSADLLIATTSNALRRGWDLELPEELMGSGD